MPRPIDANALVAKLDDWRGDIEDVDEKDAHDVAYYSAMSRALRFAKDAPTLDYAPVRHSKWKYYHKQNRAVCMACSFERDLDADFGAAVCCPNCGARMDEKEDER